MITLRGCLLLASLVLSGIAPAKAQHYTMLFSEEMSGQLYTVNEYHEQRWLPLVGRTPSWTPDGRIIYVSTAASPPQITIASATGVIYNQVGRLPFPDIVKPQMAPGGIIIFTAAGSIWRINQDGSGFMPVVPSGISPSLAPSSGLWFAYAVLGAAPSHNQIWRANIDGGSPQRLTDDRDPDYPSANAPAVSYAEDVIAFFTGVESGRGQGLRNIAIMPALGGTRKVLTDCIAVPTAGACLTADNPFWWQDYTAVGYDQGGPIEDLNGTWVVSPDGLSGQHKFWPAGRGAGALPVRMTP